VLLDYESIDEYLKEIGFSDRHEIKYNIRYYCDKLREYFYISKTSGKQPATLIIHPKYQPELPSLIKGIPGVINENPFKHGTSMRKFPAKLNNGKSPTAYGIPLGFRNKQSLSLFIEEILDSVTIS